MYHSKKDYVKEYAIKAAKKNAVAKKQGERKTGVFCKCGREMSSIELFYSVSCRPCLNKLSTL